MLGGHLDSVLDGPGINDNGSGVATLLSLARSVATGEPPTKSIRFGFWGAEEFGELGSSSYVQGLSTSDVSLIGSYLNLDMVASPNAARYVYGDAGAPAGSEELIQMLLDALSDAGMPALRTDIGGSSDHFMFEQRGVPSAGVFSGLNPLTDEEAATFGAQAGLPADPCYHLSCDTRDNVNLDSAATLGSAIASVLQELAYPAE
jgi:aminopeptidase S